MTPNLTARTARALGWAYALTAARLVVQFLTGILLARLLGPEPFGIVAAAWIIVGLGSQFVDCGFGSALIQRGEISPREVRFAFTLQVCAGLMLCGLMAISSPALARWLGNPAAAPAIGVLSIALLLQALGQTAASLLRRALDFRTLQIAQFTGVVIGYGVVALPMAVLGSGLKSLIAGQLVQTMASTAISYAKVRHPIAPLLDFRPRWLLRFGVKVMTTNLLNWLIAGLDSLAMTRYFGTVPTGLFNRAQVLAIVPGGQFVQVLQSVLFPAYSRRVDEIAILRKIFFASLAGVGLLLLPWGVVLALSAQTAVVALYGSGWSAAAQFLMPLALAMPLHGAMAICGPVLWACDRVATELRVQAAVLIIFAAVLFFTGRISAPAMAWSVPLVYLLRCGLMMRCTLAAIGARWSECFQVLRPACALAGVAGMAATTVDALIPNWHAGARLSLIALTALPLSAGTVLTGRLLPSETAAFLRLCCARLPLVPGIRRGPAGDAAWKDAI